MGNMVVYNKGVWSEVDNISDDWSIGSKTGLTYAGYESSLIDMIGNEHGCHVEVYVAEDIEKAVYRYLVCLETGCMGDAVLVPDFASLLMLIKEFLPLIEMEIKQEAHEVLMEEHEWRVKDWRSKRGERVDCAHL